MRILLVEDEMVTARLIKKKLAGAGIEVDSSEDSERALGFLSYDHYDVIILDLELAGCDGLAVLRRLRKQGAKVPIFVLSHHAALQDKLAALDNGADDFLVKPFSFAELLARLRALTRRAWGLWTGQLEFDGLMYDPRERLISFKGSNVRLSKREGQMLELFLREKRKTVARETILSHIWGPGEAMPNSADALARLLRQKIATLPAGIAIRTVRGLGYRLDIESTGEQK